MLNLGIGGYGFFLLYNYSLCVCVGRGVKRMTQTKCSTSCPSMNFTRSFERSVHRVSRGPGPTTHSRGESSRNQHNRCQGFACFVLWRCAFLSQHFPLLWLCEAIIFKMKNVVAWRKNCQTSHEIRAVGSLNSNQF